MFLKVRKPLPTLFPSNIYKGPGENDSTFNTWTIENSSSSVIFKFFKYFKGWNI
jgi:hypothetical protein